RPHRRTHEAASRQKLPRVRRERFTEPVALSSAASTDFPPSDLAAFPRTAPGDDLDLLALRARCKPQSIAHPPTAPTSLNTTPATRGKGLAVAVALRATPRAICGGAASLYMTGFAFWGVGNGARDATGGGVCRRGSQAASTTRSPP